MKSIIRHINTHGSAKVSRMSSSDMSVDKVVPPGVMKSLSGSSSKFPIRPDSWPFISIGTTVEISRFLRPTSMVIETTEIK